MKGIVNLISTISALLLGAVAWPEAGEPSWKVYAVAAGMAASIFGMALRFLAHRKKLAERAVTRIAMAIEDILLECGFTSFDFAASPEAAIAAASRRCPDLITSDVQLKPGCGIDTVLSICRGKSIPVIFNTGNADDVTQRIPDSHVLPKPFTAKSLAAAVALASLG